MSTVHFSYSKFIHENFSKNAIFQTEKFHQLTSFALKVFELNCFKAAFPRAYLHFHNTFQILDFVVPSAFSMSISKVQYLVEKKGLGWENIKVKLASLDLFAETTSFLDGIFNIINTVVPIFKLVMPRFMVCSAHALKILKEAGSVMLGLNKLENFDSYRAIKVSLKILCLASAIIASVHVFPLFACISGYSWGVDISISIVDMILCGFEK